MLNQRLLTCFLCLSIFPSQILTAQDKKDYFVFLTTGKSTEGVAKEEIQKKQAAHLENFGRLAKLGALSTAGPCSDPNKTTRGIVVIHADSIANAEALFGPDPYVSEGFMKAEMHQYRTVAGKIILDLESNALDQYVIAILRRGEKWPTTSADPTASTTIDSKLARFAADHHSSKKVAFAALFTELSNNRSGRVAVMIFRGKELEPVKSLLESQPLVSDGLLSFEAFPQYLAKNALPE
ncbi:MAG: YciI family protein [Pirellula sp.]